MGKTLKHKLKNKNLNAVKQLTVALKSRNPKVVIA